MIQRKFTRRFALDTRDHPLQLPAPISKKDITRKLWRDGWSGDQLDTPACVGHAWTHWLSNTPISQYLDPQGIYKLAQYLDEWPKEDYEGTSVRGGAKVLHKLGFIGAYQWAQTINEITTALLTTGPVVIGVNWYVGMSDPDTKNIMHTTGYVEGGHAVLLNGVDTKKELMRVKNSWGKDWGVKGYAWLPFTDLARLLKEDGEACIGLEIKPIPK